MSEPRRSFTFEHLLYLLIVVVGLGIRYFRLGAMPLSDFEAAAALPALEAESGAFSSQLGAQPLYAVLTWLLFFIFDSSNFLARFWPALAGGLLPVLPILLRRRLGHGPGLILALGLALDPGLVAASRLAGGPVLALFFGLLALVLPFSALAISPARKAVLSGLFLGLALLAGPSFWLGALSLGMAFFSLRVLNPGGPAAAFTGINSLRRPFLGSLALTLLLAGTLFLRFPQGIGALGEGLTAFIGGWSRSSGVPSSRLLAALLAYQGLVLAFGLVGTWRAWREGVDGKAAGLFALGALLILMLYPGRQVVDLVWMLPPLWLLAALELGRVDPGTGLFRVVSAGLAVVLLTLGASAWVNLARLSTQVIGANYAAVFAWTVDQYVVNLIVILGAVLLMALSFTTIRLWDPLTARRGLAWGLGVMLLFGMTAGTWAVSTRDPVAQRELWLPEPHAGQADLLRKSLHELGGWTAGQPVSLEISTDYDSPSLRWALRDFPNVRFGAATAGGTLPAVVLAADDSRDLRLASSYRGQDFIWTVQPAWELLGLDGWLRWWVFRSAPAQEEQIILWAKADLFLAGEEQTAADASENDSDAPIAPQDQELQDLP